jgi:hypothetical protein
MATYVVNRILAEFPAGRKKFYNSRGQFPTGRKLGGKARPRIKRFNESEYALPIDVLEASRRRVGFLLCGYVLMPNHWHALIWPQYPNLARRGGSRTALSPMRAIVDESGSRTAPTCPTRRSAGGMRNAGTASRPPTAKGLADIGVQDIEACSHLSPKGAN